MGERLGPEVWCGEWDSRTSLPVHISKLRQNAPCAIGKPRLNHEMVQRTSLFRFGLAKLVYVDAFCVTYLRNDPTGRPSP